MVWRLGPWNWLCLLTALLFMVAAYWGGIQELANRWEKQEEYSHGYLIPLIALYFIWQKQAIIQRSRFSPSWIGFFIVCIGLAVFVVGEVSALYILIHYSFVVVLLGLAIALMGWPAVKPVLIPLLLLVFAIPLPYFIEVGLSAKLQLLSSKLGVTFIRWCHIPVYLEGNIIDLGVYKLQVVEACNGLRYLFPLMSLGFICAYMFDAAFWKRAVIFLSTIPITIIMNSFRIGMIGVLVENWGPSMAEGFLHDFEGWIVFMACLILLIFEMALLARLGKDGRPLSEIFGSSQVMEDADTVETVKTRSLSSPLIASLLSLGLVTIVVFSIDKREEFIPSRIAFPEFPLQLGDWRGTHEIMESVVIDKLELSDYILADYVKEASPPVNLYVAYYESQRKGVSPHSPRVCIPGGGWQITDIMRTHLGDLPVNRIVIKKGDATQLVYYWFQQRGRRLANEYIMKWYLFKDALLLNRTDGALVRLTTPVSAGEKLSDADTRLRDFAQSLLPVLPAFIPD